LFLKFISEVIQQNPFLILLKIVTYEFILWIDT